MKFDSADQLPAEATCLNCGETKPLCEMIVFRNRPTGKIHVRTRCKECNNEKERGHRREYKREYLRRWRARNRQLNESYWKDNPRVREQSRINAARRVAQKHDAILIQGRLARRGLNVSTKEAEELLAKFGRCYPTRLGLTTAGLRECEGLRSAFRKRPKARRPSALEIRIMLYEDWFDAKDQPSGEGGDRYVIPPDRQPVPYQSASRKLKSWWVRQRALKNPQWKAA